MRRRLPPWSGPALALLVLAIAPAAEAADVWTTPFPGVRYLHRSTSEPKEIHAMVVDLSRPEITLRTTRSTEKGRTTTSFSNLVSAAGAVNGDFYNTNGSYDPVGLAIGEGAAWSNDTAGHSFIACTAAKACEIDTSGQSRAADPSWQSAVGGNTILVRNGMVAQSAADDTSCGEFCTTPHPRTAAGLSADGHTLILVVVEGRQTPLTGLSTHRLAELMLDLGAATALNLDGGGSSAMVVAGRRVSGRPSNEPSERSVSNHLAVLYDATPPTTGRLVGFIREGDIQNAQASLPGATVTLSTGPATTTNGDGLYEFAAVPPGAVTVTAALAGYTTASDMKVVQSGITNWKSIALTRAARPDAGAPRPDAGNVRPDAGSTAADAGERSPDAGDPSTPDAGASSPELDAGAGSPEPDAAEPTADAGSPAPADPGELPGAGEASCTCLRAPAAGPGAAPPAALAFGILIAGLTRRSRRRAK